MSLDRKICVLTFAAALAAPASAWAYSGLGCTNLPAYDRAVGALQGMPAACDMSIEEAKRIVAEHDGQAGVRSVPVAPRGRTAQP